MGACNGNMEAILRCEGNFDPSMITGNNEGGFERITEPTRSKADPPRSGLIFSYERGDFIKWLRLRI